MIKKLKYFLKFILLLIVIIVAVTVMIGHKKFKTAITELPLETAVEQIKEKNNYTKIEDISPMYIDAVIATEDRRFRTHDGFDIFGIVRAFSVNIKEKKLSEGASTITQQLAKNIYFLNDNSAIRKIAEIFMASEIEKNYTKDEILELYFNVIYYGSGYYNIYDASMGYFEKHPSEMNDFEATLLAGIPNAPSLYSPKVNPELSYKRQEKVIKCLVDAKYITEDEAQIILADK